MCPAHKTQGRNLVALKMFTTHCYMGFVYQ